MRFPEGIRMDERRTTSIPAPSRCGGLVTVARLKHYVLFVDPDCRVVVAQRTATPFSVLSEIESSFCQIEGALAGVERSSYGLLVDTRSGPSRNDGTFEVELSKHRGKLLFGFARNVALTASAVGQLQVQRYAKTDGRVVFATDNLSAAFAYLELPHHSVS
jgi:hypothetical protein